MKKQCVVIGLGEFGTSVALALAEQGCDVLAVDQSMERIEAVADYVTHAVTANAAEPDVLNSLGIRNFDVAVITIGNNLEASIMATILVKEAGIPYVLVKADNDLHAQVLRKVGADEVVFPEKAMGVRVARNLVAGHFIDMIELSEQFSIVEISTPENWVGKTLMELQLRKKGLNIIARKEGNTVETSLDPERVLAENEVYIICGPNQALQHLNKKEKSGIRRKSYEN